MKFHLDFMFLLGCHVTHECNVFTVKLQVIFPPLEFFRSVMPVKARQFMKSQLTCKVSFSIATSSSMLISYVVITMVCQMVLVVNVNFLNLAIIL